MCVSQGTNPCSVGGMLGSPGAGASGRAHTHVPDRELQGRPASTGGEGHLPRGPRGGAQEYLAPAHVRGAETFAQELITRETGAAARASPEIRWAENAKNRDFETLPASPGPPAGEAGPLGLGGPTVAPDQAWGAQRDTLLEEGRDGENRGRASREEGRKPTSGGPGQDEQDCLVHVLLTQRPSEEALGTES